MLGFHEDDMPRETNQKAVIYCRVSGVKQTTRGDGLGSQETRCREYARYRGHDIARVFKDDASGSLVARPAMQEMLAFLKSHRKESYVVIIDDISRLARGLDAHLRLRAALSAVGARLESPSIEFGEDSDSVLVENLLASVSQHQRQKNGEQTKNRMRARAMNGYWVFQAPAGYSYERLGGGGRLLVRHDPVAEIVKEALEGFASERFASQVEVKRFLDAQPDFPLGYRGEITVQRVTDILTQPLYAGYLALPKWGVTMRKAQHEGLISYETYQAIQERLLARARASARKDINTDFPLRDFVCCADCEKPLTANWSAGSHGRYPYYLCRTKLCPSANRSIARAKVEDGFADLLATLKPSEDLFNLASAIFRDLWDQRLAATTERKKSMSAEVTQIDRKIEQMLDRIVDADSETLIKAYEKRVQDCEAEKLLLTERIANCGRPARDYDETFRTVMEFLANPQKLWVSERLEDKRAVVKLTFVGHLSYARNEGFRTPEMSLPFKVLGDISGSKKQMARPAGLESAASRLEVLGYDYFRRIWVALEAQKMPENRRLLYSERF
jgi:site-specific DNA recombinase